MGRDALEHSALCVLQLTKLKLNLWWTFSKLWSRWDHRGHKSSVFLWVHEEVTFVLQETFFCLSHFYCTPTFLGISEAHSNPQLLKLQTQQMKVRSTLVWNCDRYHWQAPPRISLDLFTFIQVLIYACTQSLVWAFLFLFSKSFSCCFKAVDIWGLRKAVVLAFLLLINHPWLKKNWTQGTK